MVFRFIGKTKMVQSSKILMMIIMNIYGIVCPNNNWIFVHEIMNQHISISLYDVIPDKLTKKHRQYWDKLIIGYIRVYSIPNDLKQLITCFMIEQFFHTQS